MVERCDEVIAGGDFVELERTACIRNHSLPDGHSVDALWNQHDCAGGAFFDRASCGSGPGFDDDAQILDAGVEANVWPLTSVSPRRTWAPNPGLAISRYLPGRTFVNDNLSPCASPEAPASSFPSAVTRYKPMPASRPR